MDRDGGRGGGAVVDDSGRTIWAETLSPDTSAQRAELIALIQALERAKEKRITIFTDSRYAFVTVHIQGPIYRERGFLTAEGKESLFIPTVGMLAALYTSRAQYIKSGDF